MHDPHIGEVALFAFNFAPLPWAPCAGQLLPIRDNYSDNSFLFSVIGNQFGGDGVSNFALPDYRSLAPQQGLLYCMALYGFWQRACVTGEMAICPFDAPENWTDCNGQLLQISQYNYLFPILGTRFGGDGKTTFGVPDMTLVPPPYLRPPIEKQVGEPVAASPSRSMYCIPNYPSRFSDPYICEVKLFPFTDAPSGWLPCEGQLLPIDQHANARLLPLFSLMGTTFGGNGMTNFAVPDLSKVPLPAGVKYYICSEGVFPVRPSVWQSMA